MLDRLTDSFAALREPEYRKLYLGQAISVAGIMFTVVALPFAVLAIGGSATDIGLVEAANLVPLVLVLLVGGVWADRLPRQKVMLVADLGRAALQLAAAALLISGSAHVWQLAVLQVFMGACEAFFRPAYTGLVPQTVSPARLQQANALSSLTMSASVAFGSAFAGLLVAAFGAGWAIGLDGLTYIVSAWFLWRLRPRPAAAPAAAGHGESFLRDLVAGWREFISHTWLWVMVVGASAFLFFNDGPINVLGPVIAKADYQGARTWGYLMAVMGLGEILGGGLALRWRPRRPLLIVAAGLSVTAIPTALLALRAPVSLLLPTVALMGVEWGLFDVFWQTCVQERVAPELLSRVSAWDMVGSIAFYPAGLAMAGPLSSVIGVNGVLVLGVVTAVLVSAFQLFVRDVRTLTFRPRVAAEQL